jgi:trans-2,3-dihydro-3-hydroxyanthranilate isomerase
VRLGYHLLNVFCRDGDPFSGNPLCVFESGAALSDAQMQAIARQFNLSETVFLVPSDEATARARIFTPDFEMPFAGHPTLGSAYFLSRHWASIAPGRQELSLATHAGVVPVVIEGQRATLTALPPLHRDPEFDAVVLAAALGIEADDIIWQAGGTRPLWVHTGTEQLIVPLRTPEAVRRVRPTTAALGALTATIGQHASALVFAEASPGAVLARYLFESGAEMREDPATGSACANLGGWCLATGRSLPHHCRVAQGEQIHRPSTLWLEVDATRTIRVGGDVLYLGAGQLAL